MKLNISPFDNHKNFQYDEENTMGVLINIDTSNDLQD